MLLVVDQTGVPTAPDLAPAPASWAVPTDQNITWPMLLVEKPKRHEGFQNTIQSELEVSSYNKACTECHY